MFNKKTPRFIILAAIAFSGFANANNGDAVRSATSIIESEATLQAVATVCRSKVLTDLKNLHGLDFHLNVVGPVEGLKILQETAESHSRELLGFSSDILKTMCRTASPGFEKIASHRRKAYKIAANNSLANDQKVQGIAKELSAEMKQRTIVLEAVSVAISRENEKRQTDSTPVNDKKDEWCWGPNHDDKINPHNVPKPCRR